jgi:mono/diheme cytochrome c family protein
MRKLAATTFALLVGMSAAQAASDDQDWSEIALGHSLAIAGDCSACHTVPNDKPYAGGRPLVTPFGTLVAPNITPDPETGIGAWSDDDFVNALQRGVGHNGIRLYPAMPYTYYTKVSRNDLLALRAYLNTVTPIHREVRSNRLPFPFNIRLSMAAWNALFFAPGDFKPVAGKSAEWNRGAYLVQGLGHCGACHTPKNFLGADKTSEALQGGLLQGWFAPALTDDARVGLGGWSIEDVATYLKTGHNRVSSATGPMAEVISDSTSQMDDTDLQAIAAYLKDQPGHGASPPQPLPAEDAAMRASQALYVDNCSACHAAGGTGIPQLFPTLARSASVQSADPTNLIRIILQGTQSVATDSAPTALAMPSFGWKLSDAQVAAAVTYIRNSWGNAASAVSAGEVSRARQQVSRTP